VSDTTPSPVIHLVVGDDEERVRSLAERLQGAGPRVEARPARVWPFSHPLVPPLPPGPLTVWAPHVHEAFETRQAPHTRLVTIGDHRAQHLFNALPEERRQFIPLVSADEFPYLLGQLDVLLVPLRDTDFNRAQADERLMQAGARRVPWVASPIPAHLAWGVGGLIAAERDEWYLQLRKLVTSPEVRATLALVGRQRADEREMTRLSMAWVELIEAVGRPAPPAPAREAWPVTTPSPFARQLEALAR